MPESKLSPLTHIASLMLAVLIGVITFWSTTATAASGAYYNAELASAAPATKFVSRDVMWKCDGTSCIRNQGNSRPQIMCAALVKKVGPVTGFVAGGKALDAAEVARCNGEG